jgi:endonuclease-8
MAEGDTILRTARGIEAAIGGERLSVAAPSLRGRAAGIERLDGRRLERVQTRGKHLLFHFGDLVLHSHLGMNGSWRVYRRGERWERPAAAAWAALAGTDSEAVQFGGPTLRLLDPGQLRRDSTLARLGPDVLATDFDATAALRSLQRAARRRLGDALLDQRLLAGIGNIFKSEACFAARVSPWRAVPDCSESELSAVIDAARRLMERSVAGRRAQPAVYRRAGRPCPACGTPIAARGQGDENRRTYWCPRCQPDTAAAGSGESRAK